MWNGSPGLDATRALTFCQCAARIMHWVTARIMHSLRGGTKQRQPTGGLPRSIVVSTITRRRWLSSLYCVHLRHKKKWCRFKEDMKIRARCKPADCISFNAQRIGCRGLKRIHQLVQAELFRYLRLRFTTLRRSIVACSSVSTDDMQLRRTFYRQSH